MLTEGDYEFLHKTRECFIGAANALWPVLCNHKAVFRQRRLMAESAISVKPPKAVTGWFALDSFGEPRRSRSSGQKRSLNLSSGALGQNQSGLFPLWYAAYQALGLISLTQQQLHGLSG